MGCDIMSLCMIYMRRFMLYVTHPEIRLSNQAGRPTLVNLYGTSLRWPNPISSPDHGGIYSIRGHHNHSRCQQSYRDMATMGS